MLYCMDKGISVPGQIGIAGFNGIELLDGINPRIATMDACRREIGVKAAQIIADCTANGADQASERVELTPTLNFGQTLKRR